VSGFDRCDTDTLHVVRGSLLAGLDKVAASIDAGTFHDVGPKGAAPPSQSGNLTLALLVGVNQELDRRTQCAKP
jgi:hypothetical protein